MVKKILQLTKPLKKTYRDYDSYDLGSFKIDLQDIDWTFATHNNDAELDFEAFLRLFNTALDSHAPIKEPTKEEKIDKLKQWVTKVIKKVYVS